MSSKFLTPVWCFQSGMLCETLASRQDYYREKRTLFGNELEKVEHNVIRSQRLLLKRADRRMLRNQVKAFYLFLKIATSQYLEVNVKY